ncbi:MAG: PD-(D/E)XK nuclease family protein, partial [Quisquiliibacterium sp.]
WPHAIKAVLRKFPGPPNAPLILASLVRNLLATPLPIGTASPLHLAKLDPARRLTEMEFYLPSAGLKDHHLNQFLGSAGYPIGQLGFAPLAGFLKGFIDMVFEHDGRYFVLDWKSNHLGHRVEDYSHQSMWAEMSRHGYQLQALLYSVALHRHLSSRLVDYDPQRHFGGWVYLFMRGVRPGWLQPDGSPAGLIFERPEPSLLAKLSALFDSRGPDA